MFTLFTVPCWVTETMARANVRYVRYFLKRMRAILPYVTHVKRTLYKIILTRSTGTVHTSAKARLTRVAIRSGSPPKFNHLFPWPIANLPWKFHANPFGSFCAKLLTDRHRQTATKTTSLVEVTRPTVQRHCCIKTACRSRWLMNACGVMVVNCQYGTSSIL